MFQIATQPDKSESALHFGRAQIMSGWGAIKTAKTAILKAKRMGCPLDCPEVAGDPDHLW